MNKTRAPYMHTCTHDHAQYAIPVKNHTQNQTKSKVASRFWFFKVHRLFNTRLLENGLSIILKLITDSDGFTTENIIA